VSVAYLSAARNAVNGQPASKYSMITTNFFIGAHILNYVSWKARRLHSQFILLLVFLAFQTILGSTVAFALSTGCTAKNALSTVSTTSTFSASDFDTSDTLIGNFYNDGRDTSDLEFRSDHVLASTEDYSPYLVFYASDHTTASSQTVRCLQGAFRQAA
jgi:hypothetical protein